MNFVSKMNIFDFFRDVSRKTKANDLKLKNVGLTLLVTREMARYIRLPHTPPRRHHQLWYGAVHQVTPHPTQAPPVMARCGTPGYPTQVPHQGDVRKHQCPVFLTNLEGKVGKVDEVGKVSKVSKVGRVGKVGKVGKEGKEGRLLE